MAGPGWFSSLCSTAMLQLVAECMVSKEWKSQPALLFTGGNRISAFPSTEIPQRCNPSFHTQTWHAFHESKNGIHADSDFQNNEEVVF